MGASHAVSQHDTDAFLHTRAFLSMVKTAVFNIGHISVQELALTDHRKKVTSILSVRYIPPRIFLVF